MAQKWEEPVTWYIAAPVVFTTSLPSGYATVPHPPHTLSGRWGDKEDMPYKEAVDCDLTG